MRFYVALGVALVLSCGSNSSDEETTTKGGVGTPCVPDLESDPAFTGFRIADSSAHSAAECGQGSVCLVNHFQGLVSCPAGQPAMAFCTDGEACPAGGECVEGDFIDVDCVPGDCPEGYVCDTVNAGCRSMVCSESTGCLAGSTPVAGEVCGSCDDRNFSDAVYCSCECSSGGCQCPAGFVCAAFGPMLGSMALDGSWCVREGTEFSDVSQCGTVAGHWAPTCQGLPAP